MPITLHGPAYSTYARTARLALEEKGVAYTLHEVDILSGAHMAEAHLARHPWAKVPSFEHDGFSLFETLAIARYVDEAFPGPALQPADVKARARMTQICGVIDSYGYGAMVGKAFWQAAIVPMQGGTPDQALLAEGLAGGEKTLAAIAALATPGTAGLCGEAVTLADLFLVPVLEYFVMVPAGAEILGRLPGLAKWHAGIAQRPTVVKTRPQLG